jgi:hypothetical protein
MSGFIAQRFPVVHLSPPLLAKGITGSVFAYDVFVPIPTPEED